jgi:hypothetical protein
MNIHLKLHVPAADESAGLELRADLLKHLALMRATSTSTVKRRLLKDLAASLRGTHPPTKPPPPPATAVKAARNGHGPGKQRGFEPIQLAPLFHLFGPNRVTQRNTVTNSTTYH